VLYSALAPIYDRVMAHVAYDDWVGLIQRVMQRFGAAAAHPVVLEVGGGTGVLGSLLSREGFRYQGCDLSPGMCRQAHGRGMPFFCADARALPVRGPFDLVLFLYDGINYLGSAADYQQLFTEVHAVLAPGGLFLFDITTESNSHRYFQDTFDTEDFGDAAYIRHSYFDDAAKVQHNDFVIFTLEQGAERLYRRSDERHAQRVLPVSTLRSWVPERLFEVVGTWDGYSLRPCNRFSERVHFLLRRKDGP
jgi:SAM-dependent methyltransferase